jgi:hypothetical protein
MHNSGGPCSEYFGEAPGEHVPFFSFLGFPSSPLKRSTKPLGNASSSMVSLNCLEYFFPSVCAPDQKKALFLGILHCVSILASGGTESGFGFAEDVVLGAGLVRIFFGFAGVFFGCFLGVFDLPFFALLSVFFGSDFARATMS